MNNKKSIKAMKAFNKLFVILVCLCGTMSVTSCINNDGGGGLDPEVESAYRTSISGAYTGSVTSDWRLENKIYFYNDTIDGKNVAEKTDSVVGVVGRFETDSTYMISNVPGRVLAKEFPEKYNDMKMAIENGPAQIIRGSYLINNVAQDGAALLVNGVVEIPSLTYGGETHQNIRILFWQSWATFGYISGHKAVELQLYFAAVYEGDEKLFDIYNGQSMDLTQTKANLLVRVTRY